MSNAIVPWAAEATSLLPAGPAACQRPALVAAGRPQTRTAGHGQDGWLVTGSRRGWGWDESPLHSGVITAIRCVRLPTGVLTTPICKSPFSERLFRPISQSQKTS